MPPPSSGGRMKWSYCQLHLLIEFSWTPSVLTRPTWPVHLLMITRWLMTLVGGPIVFVFIFVSHQLGPRHKKLFNWSDVGLLWWSASIHRSARVPVPLAVFLNSRKKKIRRIPRKHIQSNSTVYFEVNFNKMKFAYAKRRLTFWGG